jgi:2-C-methyl-D-erythritol 2,4-cyclodiphosphate synthase
MRTGIGYDIHRLIPTQEISSIALGGISIPCHYKIEAHSDGDVLLHALVDASLGALALGDIGQWFPDNLPENRGRPSCEFVQKVVNHVHGLGWKICQFDSIVWLERPKLVKFHESIRAKISQLLNLEVSAVSLKAKTMEGLGPIGEGLALASQALVTLEEIR